ncbi:phosphatidylinositol 4,5-bisphosphate-binding protein [Rhizina undulata]
MATPADNNPAESRFTENIEGQADLGDSPKRSSTLKKKNSLKRSDSKKSRSGSVSQGQPADRNSIYFTPIPTHGNPTEVLAERFSAWRKVLKDFITYFREVQSSYENRSKGISKISHTLNSTVNQPEFVRTGGLLETNSILRDFHKESFINLESAAKIESDVINNLVGLRNDLSLKIKEIKALSSDFKNNVDKEKEATLKEVTKLTESLGALDTNSQGVAGKNDPYILKLAVEKQLGRQLAEENYLHRAYLNLESSGRELESIVVGEIQKAFDAYVKIIKRESDELLDVTERITASTLRLPKDYEWSMFVTRDPDMVDPSVPLRSLEEIQYPGSQSPAAVEVRSGPMERKSKYLKSYTPGWYVLSPTHLHEFKSSERSRDFVPVLSLYLPESTLGKHSEPNATSHKFVLKGRQTGHMHRDHSWVFRAGSYEEMLEWYEDIKKLTEISGEERNAFVTEFAHRRTESSGSGQDGSYNSDTALDNDEADEVPYSAQTSALGVQPPAEEQPRRPEGGRFPSDLQIDHHLDDPTSGTAEYPENSTTTDAGDSGYVVIPSAQRPRSDSRSSTWSYDEKHPVTSTLEDEFAPVGAEIPPEVERNISVKHNYSQDHEVPETGRPSATFRRGPPSRKPTASYGVDPITGQPDPAVNAAHQISNIDWTHVLAASDPRPRGGSFTRRPPSRKPTASYGIDPITGQPEFQSAVRTLEDTTEPSHSLNATTPSASDLHVPGEYPKQT